MPTYTHGSYSYWIVWLLFFPLYFHIFYCVYNSYTLIRSFAALQHLNFAGISLELYLYWHMLPGLSTYQWILSLITRIYGFITYHNGGKQGFTGFNDAYHCMVVIAIACCALWTCDCWNPMGYTNSIQNVFPLLSKYGIYNFSPLIVLAHASILCYAPTFISLCGFVPHLGVVNSLLSE